MRILFTAMPFEGHVLPMTGLARRLLDDGHDVRFYTGRALAPRLEQLGVPHVPYDRALEVNGENIAQLYPEIERMRGPRRIAFDTEKVFFASIPEHVDDVIGLHREFPFDAIVTDAAFYAAYPITRRLGIPAFGISAAPSPTAKSAGAPPPFFGLTPARTPLGWLRDRLVWAMVEGSTRRGVRVFDSVLAREGLSPYADSPFQLPWDTVEVMFQTGVPAMDFEGLDWPDNHMFVGPLLPPRSTRKRRPAVCGTARRRPVGRHRLAGHRGQPRPGKLLVPTLTALAGTEHLVVACTGGRNTAALQQAFPQDNVVITDWADFDVLLPHCDVFITNGGYGSVMQALMAECVLITAGLLEGKNDVNARLASRGLALDLRTDHPTPAQIGEAVQRAITDVSLRRHVQRVAHDLQSRDPLDLMARTFVGHMRRFDSTGDAVRLGFPTNVVVPARTDVHRMSRSAGVLLLIAAAANLAGVVLFFLRNGVAGGPPPSYSYLIAERGLLMAAMLVSALGFCLLGDDQRRGSVLLRVGTLGYLAAGVVGVVAETMTLVDRAAYPTTAAYVVLAFLTQAVIGLALARSGLVAPWVGWLTLVWNLAWLVGLSLGSPGDIYFPILHMVMTIPIGIALLRSARRRPPAETASRDSRVSFDLRRLPALIRNSMNQWMRRKRAHAAAPRSSSVVVGAQQQGAAE